MMRSKIGDGFGDKAMDIRERLGYDEDDIGMEMGMWIGMRTWIGIGTGTRAEMASRTKMGMMGRGVRMMGIGMMGISGLWDLDGEDAGMDWEMSYMF